MANSVIDLYNEVINAGLCTLCGACVGDCPYLTFYKGKIQLLDYCNRTEGHCYKHCPRTFTDMDKINQMFHGTQFNAGAIGPFKSILIARSKNKEILAKAQYGGVVTTLLSLVLDAGLIDKAIAARTGKGKMPTPFIASTTDEILDCAGSNYMAFPLLEALNRMPRNSNDKLGIVVTPCQALALAKMRLDPPTQGIDLKNIRLTVGLFCTWALSYDHFSRFLLHNMELPKIRRFDIPPPPSNKFNIYTDRDILSISLDEIRKYRMQTCTYCIDMTAELTDISVGSAEDIEGWNTVIIRTQTGQEIIESAAKKSLLEIKTLPETSFSHLKEAALNKKSRALKAIVNKTGNMQNLLYLGMSEDVRDKLLSSELSKQGGH